MTYSTSPAEGVASPLWWGWREREITWLCRCVAESRILGRCSGRLVRAVVHFLRAVPALSNSVHKSSRLCENAWFTHKRARSERFFAIGRLLIVQGGTKFRENLIGQLGVRVFTQSARIMHREVASIESATYSVQKSGANGGFPPRLCKNADGQLAIFDCRISTDVLRSISF
jgi:hypothetical protein